MIRIGVVAPGRRLTEDTGARALSQVANSGLPVELVIHPQCYLSFGHFAGTDSARLEAFIEYANDPTIDAIWFARGGYGTARLLAGLPGRLNDHALNKVYLGYSDIGFLLAALSHLGCNFCAHGPLVADILRENGELAFARALGFLSRTDHSGLEPSVNKAAPNIAYNLSVIRSLLGTKWLSKQNHSFNQSVLWIEDVAEFAYATDRSMFQLSGSDWFDAIKGVRIGRFSAVPQNDVPFPINSIQAVEEWCAKSNVPILGHADIGHDSDNKIVPFGDIEHWRAAGLV